MEKNGFHFVLKLLENRKNKVEMANPIQIRLGTPVCVDSMIQMFNYSTEVLDQSK